MRRALLIFVAVVLCHAVRAQSEFPNGFGGINVGTKWEEIRGQFEFQRLDTESTTWDQYASQCGFQVLLLEAENGRILATLNDFVVTDVTYATPIEPNSDLLAIADLVMQNYGQPERASMRNVVGQVTIDRSDVNFITLEYRKPKLIRFTVSGREQWEYRINIRFEHSR